MSTIQMEGLWQFIQTMSLSKKNRLWLAERLTDSTKEANMDVTQTKAYQEAIADKEAGRISGPFKTTEELFSHLGI